MRLAENRSTSKPKVAARALSVVLSLTLLLAPVSAEQASPQAGDTVIRVTSELVLTNVTVRDKSGNFVRGLKPEDFTILEDNKPQQIASFDFEDVDAAQLPAAEQAQGQGPQQAVVLAAPKPADNAPAPGTASLLKHHRLVVLFFDLSSMQPDEIGRGVAAAQKYVDQQMSPADLVAVVSLANDFQVNLDFTADRAQLGRVLQSMDPGSGQGFENGLTGDTEGTSDTAQAFTPDETEYNIFNADRRLEALRSLASLLSHIEQKKSVIYISSGMTRTGIDNQSELRAAINDAVRANLSIYTMDVRGLQAIIPGGDASQASIRGTSAYSGAAMRTSMDSNFSSQETLVTLASDTGGKAFLDTNDLGSVFRGVQQDTATYYVLGYHSTNPARDGRFRRVSVRVNVPDVKLDYRAGYYAPRDFQHSNKDDRERLLDEEMASDIPSTDLRVYLSTAYFRLRDDKIYSSVSLLVPGSQIPFLRSKEQDKASLDIEGIVQDEAKRPAGRVRDTVQLAVPEAQDVARKNVQYNTAFVLAPGKYHLKFVMRENQSGKLGSFQTDLEVPDFKSAPVKASTILLAGQRQTSAKRQADNPLTRDGMELIPSVTHVFSQKQHLYLYYEVYDPGREDGAAAETGEKTSGAEPSIRVLSNVLFFNGKVKAYETPLVESRALNIPNRHAAVFQLDIPLAGLRPGLYTCQVNLIDDAAGRFLFRRLPIRLLQ